MRETEGVEGARDERRCEEEEEVERRHEGRAGVRDWKGSRTKGRVKRGAVGIEYQRGTWLEGTEEEMRGIESTFVCLFSPTPCSSSISPH